jgi:hypothetical protein
LDGGTDSAALVADAGAPDVPSMCVAGLGGIPRTQLTAAVTRGMCMASTDLDLLCGNDVGLITRGCGQACYLKVAPEVGPIDAAALKACIIDCVKTQLTGKGTLSDGCLGCYGETVTCTISKCLAPCAVSTTGQACNDCMMANMCTSSFYMCSGLPQPMPADGGARLDGPVDGSAADAAADMAAPADTRVADAPAAEAAAADGPAADAPAADAPAADAPAGDAPAADAASADSATD